MQEHFEKVIGRLRTLEGLVERLQTVESGIAGQVIPSTLATLPALHAAWAHDTIAADHRWASWTPTYSASASMTFTSVVTEVADYCIVGRVCHIILFAYGTTGGTASNKLFATLPIPATQRTANVALGFDAASGGREVLALIDPASLTQVSLLLPGFANWSLGVGREIKISLSYRI